MTEIATAAAAAPPDAPAAAPASPKWRNPWRWLPRARWAVQLAYLAFLLLVGREFARFAAEAAGPGEGPIGAARPPAVEAFLPISALLGLKRLVLTGAWDEVHPAGLTILLAAIGSALLARRAFCSWVCPVGTLSRAVEWVGRKTLWRRRWPAVPRWLDVPLSALKYVLLGFFLLTIVVRMPLEAVEGFLAAPYNLVADAKLLALFASPTATFLGVVGGLTALSLVVKHAWCRWLCPYGALLGVFSWLSPVMVRRTPEACHDCQACSRACPVEIPVHTRLRVLSPDCTGCLSCVAACASPDCLGVTRKGVRAWPAWVLPAAGLGVMLGAWLLARATGRWETTVPGEVFRWAYQVMGMGAN